MSEETFQALVEKAKQHALSEDEKQILASELKCDLEQFLHLLEKIPS